MCAHHSHDSRLWLGLVAFVIGAVILLQRFDIVPSETWDYLWPSILVVSGLKLMIAGGHKDMCDGGECCGMGACSSCGMEDCDGEACEVPMPMKKKMGKKPAKK